jgi:hypothetical protein
MNVDTSNNLPTFTYKIQNGISNVEGAINILTEMEYPEEILYIVGNK